MKGENSMEFGVWSLVPPVLTIALALTTKNVFISLLIGILTGNLVLNHFAVFTGLNAGIYSILDTMTESNTLIIGSVLSRRYSASSIASLSVEPGCEDMR